MADRVWKGVYPQVFGHYKQLLLNKFFDPSTPPMRKVDNGEKKKENNDVYTLMLLPVDRPTGTPHARANKNIAHFYSMYS